MLLYIIHCYLYYLLTLLKYLSYYFYSIFYLTCSIICWKNTKYSPYFIIKCYIVFGISSTISIFCYVFIISYLKYIISRMCYGVKSTVLAALNLGIHTHIVVISFILIAVPILAFKYLLLLELVTVTALAHIPLL
ncbi:unknown [Mycoplasma sp. CAG:611]|nr:unknown [Mycoplasma sp. CAG:611]